MLIIAIVIGGVYYLNNSLLPIITGIGEGLFFSSYAISFWKMLSSVLISFFWAVLGYGLSGIIGLIFKNPLKKILNFMCEWETWIWISVVGSIAREIMIRIESPLSLPKNLHILMFSIIFGFILIFVAGYVSSQLLSLFVEFISSILESSTKSGIRHLTILTIIVFLINNDISILGENISGMWRTFWQPIIYSGRFFERGLWMMLGAFLIALFLLIVAGIFIKKQPLYYLLVQPNQFDVEDISAMSIAVHKSILRVLDDAGIDVSQLRTKEQFTGGRKGENI
jgi:hypothetical protein